jgi:hypothetical protein
MSYKFTIFRCTRCGVPRYDPSYPADMRGEADEPPTWECLIMYSWGPCGGVVRAFAEMDSDSYIAMHNDFYGGRMARLDLSIVLDPVSDLTLVEKFACAREYGNEWFDDLDLTVRARSGLNLHFMRPEATVTECAIQEGRLGTMSEFSIYLFHHA